MKLVVTAITAMALTFSARAQMRAVAMGGRPASTTRFGVARPMASSGVGMRRPLVPGVTSARLGGGRNIIVTSVPFGPFFKGFFPSPGFFRSPFCFQNPFFCRKLFFRRAFFGGFGAFDGFPIGAFPVVSGSAFLATDPAAVDTAALQQEGGAVAELQREVQEERLRTEELERQLAESHGPEASDVRPSTDSAADVSAPPTVLVFRNGTRAEIQNYAIAGKVLYAFAPHGTKKILISELDVPATIKANERRGVEFHLPRTAQVITYP